MSARPVKPFAPNDAQLRWLERFDGTSSYIRGVSITIAELHQLLDAGLLVLSNTRAGYSKVSVEVEFREAA